MAKSILLLCPKHSDEVWCEEEQLFFRTGPDHEIKKRVRADILTRFLRIVDERTAVAFAKTYGPVQPMRASGQDVRASAATNSIKLVIAQAERLRLIRNSPRDSTWKPTDYYQAVGYLQALVNYCNLRPAIIFDEERETYRTTLTDQPATPSPAHLNLLSCALSAVIYFLMEEFTGRQGEEVHMAKCAACGRNFQADRIPSEDRRSWCPSCRGTARQWSAIKRHQRVASVDSTGKVRHRQTANNEQVESN
jgi:hypothetical protein